MAEIPNGWEVEKKITRQPDIPEGFKIETAPGGATPLQKIEEKSRSFGSWIGRGVESAGNFVAGTGEYAPKINPETGKPYKEIGSASLGKGFKGTLREMYVGGLFNLESDPKYRANLIKKYFPKVKSVEVDKDGDPIFTLRNGEKYILNQRGLSMQDVADTSSFVGKATIGGALGLGKTILGTAVKSGLTFAGGTAAGDVASNVAGSGRPVGAETAVRTVSSGVLGALGGAGGHMLFRGLSSMARFGRFVKKSGELTATARKYLKDAGFNPDDFTPSDIRILNRVLPTARNADEARRLLLSQKFNVPVTRGQVSQRPSDLRFEESVKKDVQGLSSIRGNDLREALTTGQAKNLEDASGRVIKGITGLDPVEYTGQGMDRSLRAMSALSKRQGRGVTRAYNAARASNETMPQSKALALYEKMRAHQMENYGPDEIANLAGIKKIIDAHPNGVPVKLLEGVRKKWGNVGPTSMRFHASKSARRMLDEGVDSPAFVAARKAYKAFKGSWGDDQTLAKILKVDTDVEGNVSSKLIVSPEEAVNMITGKSGVAKTGAHRTLGRIKTLLGEESRAWRDVQREVSAKLFDGKKPFDTAYKEAMKESRSLMETVYSPRDLKVMADFAELTHVVRYNPYANFSNTEITRAANSLLGRLGGVLGRAMPSMARGVYREFKSGAHLVPQGSRGVSPFAPGLGAKTLTEGTPDGYRYDR